MRGGQGVTTGAELRAPSPRRREEEGGPSGLEHVLLFSFASNKAECQGSAYRASGRSI